MSHIQHIPVIAFSIVEDYFPVSEKHGMSYFFLEMVHVHQFAVKDVSMVHALILISVFVNSDGLVLIVRLRVNVMEKVVVSMKLILITAATVEITLP
jgi:hypothetical protein